MAKPNQMEVGDEVRYTADFLRSTGQITGDAPQRRGKVTELKDLGGTVFAMVAWNDCEKPGMVHAGNICRLTSIKSYAM